jgi:hypothetical protein
MSISKYKLKKKLGKSLGTTTVAKYEKEINSYLDAIAGVDEKLAYEMLQAYIVKKFMKN